MIKIQPVTLFSLFCLPVIASNTQGDHWDLKLPGVYNLPNSSSMLSLPSNHYALLGADSREFARLSNGQSDETIEAVVFDENFDTAVWFESNDSGYIHLNDWEQLNSEDLLKLISENTEKANEERRKNNISEIHVVGWLQPPILDRNSNTVYWAIEATENENKIANSVAIRLSRKGYEKLTWSTDKSSYTPFGGQLDIMLRSHNFDQGYRYSDYMAGDRAAGYGIATLVGMTLGGKIAKVGGLSLLLKKIGGFITAGLGVLFLKFKKLFKRKKDEPSS